MTASALNRAGVGSRDPGVGARVPTKATARMHREVSTLLTITHRLGLRLKHVQRNTSVDALPDEAFLETYRRYSDTLRWCMAEERQRRAMPIAKAGEDEPPMTDEEVSGELRAIAIEAMSDDDLRAELERRAATVPAPAGEGGA